MNEVIRRCRDCGEKMNLVLRNKVPLKPLRYVCRCGRLETA